MRKGQLIAEDTPSNLLTNYDCKLLEDVVLKLCRYDQKKRSQSKQTANSTNETQFQESFRSAKAFDSDEFHTPLILEEGYAKVVTHYHWKQTIRQICSSFQRVYGFIVVMMLGFIRLPM